MGKASGKPFGEPTTVVVSIGRNLRGTDAPMIAEQWGAFVDSVHEVVTEATEAVYFAGEGTGVYEGRREGSYTVIAAAPADRGPLREALAYLATMFDQESIAVTYGTTYFVEAKPIL